MKLIYKYDQDGYYLPGEDLVIRDNDLIPESFTDVPLPVPNWKPKYHEGMWIETITQEEKDMINNPPPLPKTELEELREKNSELECAILELTELSSAQESRNSQLENALMEMSVIAASNEAKVTENEEALLETTMLVGGMNNV